MDKAIIGTQIKNQRLRLGLTQTEFGNKIAEFCGVNIYTFLDQNGNIPDIKHQTTTSVITEKELQLIHKLRALSPERRKAIEILFGIRNKK